MNRIPRKKKKFFKKLWNNRDGQVRYIVKSSIVKSRNWDAGFGNMVWGCLTRFQHDTKVKTHVEQWKKAFEV